MAEPRIQQNYFVPSDTPRAKAIDDLGTSSVEVIGRNDKRSRLLFFNPNVTANIFICPGSDTDGNSLDAVVNGGGSIWLVPGGYWEVQGDCYAAFNAIADDSPVALTIWES